ncbi:MAG: hypothetical protein M1831_004192 [Alyxoria varia]|nr:MAG: hypothetical protein M1831_004192 [Alyxoria varia]
MLHLDITINVKRFSATSSIAASARHIQDQAIQGNGKYCLNAMDTTVQASKSVRFAEEPDTIGEKKSHKKRSPHGEQKRKHSLSLFSSTSAAAPTVEEHARSKRSWSERMFPRKIKEQLPHNQKAPKVDPSTDGLVDGTGQSADLNQERKSTATSAIAYPRTSSHLTAWTHEDKPTAEEEEEDRIAEARLRACDMSFETKGRRQQLYDKRTNTLLPTDSAATLHPGSDVGIVEHQKVLDEAMRPGPGVVNEAFTITTVSFTIPERWRI